MHEEPEVVCWNEWLQLYVSKYLLTLLFCLEPKKHVIESQCTLCGGWNDTENLRVKMFCRFSRLPNVFLVTPQAISGGPHWLAHHDRDQYLSKLHKAVHRFNEKREENGRDGKWGDGGRMCSDQGRVYWSSRHDGLRGSLSLQSKTNEASDGRLCSHADQLERAQQREKNNNNNQKKNSRKVKPFLWDGDSS